MDGNQKEDWCPLKFAENHSYFNKGAFGRIFNDELIFKERGIGAWWRGVGVN